MNKLLCFIVTVAVCASPLAAQERDPLERFKALDQNKDGKVTKAEAGETAWKRYERMDLDGDGNLTQEEFQAYLTRQDRPGAVPTSFVVATFANDKKDGIEYSWFAPKNLPQGTRLPLVLCLHGAGGSTQAAKVLAMPTMQEKYPCFVMAPRGDKQEAWANADVLARQRPRERLPIVIEAIQFLVQKEAIDPSRIYVTGQSMGGVGTWAALARYPDLFAAGVPVCGAWNVKDVDQLTKTPLWAFHGAKDETVPPKWSRELTDAITKAGGQAKYTEYPDIGHGSWDAAYKTEEMWEWLFGQKRKKEM